jgi:hypothetical protein
MGTACGSSLGAVVPPPQNLRQLGTVGGDAPRLVAACRSAATRPYSVFFVKRRCQCRGSQRGLVIAPIGFHFALGRGIEAIGRILALALT